MSSKKATSKAPAKASASEKKSAKPAPKKALEKAKSAAKPAPAKKAAAKPAPAKKAAAAKPAPAKKPAAKPAPAKKVAPAKAPAKAAPAKKSAEKKDVPAKKAPAKAVSAAPAKSAPAKKPAAKPAPAAASQKAAPAKKVEPAVEAPSAKKSKASAKAPVAQKKPAEPQAEKKVAKEPVKETVKEVAKKPAKETVETAEKHESKKASTKVEYPYAVLLEGGKKPCKFIMFIEIDEQEERANKKKVTSEMKSLEKKPTSAIRHKISLAEETQEELTERILKELEEQNAAFTREAATQICTRCNKNLVSPEFWVDKHLGYCEECAAILHLGQSKEARKVEYQLGAMGGDSLDEVDDDDIEGPDAAALKEAEEELADFDD